MGAFLYWLEGESAPMTRAKLAACGLGYAFDAVPHHLNSSGPGGSRGLLLADEPALAPFLPNYRPEEQSWREAPAKYRPPGAGRLFIGLYNDAPRPTAMELLRKSRLPGSSVQLADGAHWIVPTVRSVDVAGSQYSPLPSYVRLNASGKPERGDILDSYRAIWEAATPFWDAWYAGFTAALEAGLSDYLVSLDDEPLYDGAATMLAANYRVGPVECDLLQLFATTGHLGDVMRAACDCDVAMAILQKKTPGRSES